MQVSHGSESEGTSDKIVIVGLIVTEVAITYVTFAGFAVQSVKKV